MRKAVIFLTIIFFTNLIGAIYFNAYLTWWFDMLHHFWGGFFVAMLMAHYLKITELQITNYPASPRPESSEAGELRQIQKYLIIVGAVSFIGIVWEFAEYLAGQTLIEPIYNNFGVRAYFIGDLDDTINDLLMDVLGALIFLLTFKRR